MTLGRPVSEVLQTMDSREISEWMAFFRLRNKERNSAAMTARAEQAKERAKSKLKKRMRG